MDVTTVPIRDLKHDDRNARLHDERNIAEVQRSLLEFGQHAPLVVQRSTMKVLVGNGRLEAMKRLGWKEAAVFFVDDDDKQAVRRALADNRTAELAEWDDDVLRNILRDIEDAGLPAIGWSDEELRDLLGEEREVEDDDYNIDAALAAREQAICRRGDIWTLGQHRLICGDATRPEDMARLMDGAEARLVVTDPPYNVDYVGKTADALKIENDHQDAARFREFLAAAFETMHGAMAPGAAFYIFHPDSDGLTFRQTAEATGLRVRQCLIWVKQSIVMGRQDYHWQHEPILYGWREGAGHYFCADRTLSTVIDDARPQDLRKMTKPDLIAYAEAMRAALRGDETTVIRENRPSRSTEHPTMKPVVLCGRLITNSSRRGDIVLDSFGGSGSTLIAAEQLDRPCRMIELDERYADVIIDRWEAFTGQKARLEGRP